MRVFRVATFVACIGTAAAQGALLSLLSRFQVPTGTPQPSSSSSSFSSEPTPGSGGFFISAFTEDVAPPLDINDFETPKFAVPLSIAEAVAGVNASVTTISSNAIKAAKALLPSLLFPDWAGKIPNRYRSVIEPFKFHKRQTQCSNPRIRTEWDSYSASDRQAFIDALRCLMTSPPKNNIGGARNRYEDLVALHQTLTPTVHGNAKFLLWHRYYLWTVEDVLRKECGFNRNFPWFDETKYAGSFGRSSIFSSQYFGTFAARGDCVRTGQFANITINVGPGSRNVRHCLSRNGNEQKTQNCNAAIVRACNNRGTYADMASCAEGAAHAWGHNGIGAVMQDTYAAPADPVFWLHHAFIDRNFAQWQNANVRTRTTTVGGTDENGRRLTVDTTIAVGNVRPSVRIGDLLNTLNSGICYRYDA